MAKPGLSCPAGTEIWESPRPPKTVLPCARARAWMAVNENPEPVSSPTSMPEGIPGTTEPAQTCSAARGEQRFQSTAEIFQQCPIWILMPAGVFCLWNQEHKSWRGPKCSTAEGEIPHLPGRSQLCWTPWHSVCASPQPFTALVPHHSHGPREGQRGLVQRGTQRGHARPELEPTAVRQEALIKAKT